MAKKRGGIAGIYDRNKGLIKAAAPIAAGFIPGVGPLVGAALGAAMGGDREGKGYFKGFDVGGAVKGGLSGYGGAKLGQAAKGGLGKLFTAGSPGGSALNLPSATSVMPDGLSGIGSAAGAAPSAAGVPDIAGLGSKYVTPMSTGQLPMMPPSPMSPPPPDPNKYVKAAQKAGSFLDRNQKTLGGAADRVLKSMENSAAGQAMADKQELENSKFEYQKKQDTDEQERRRRIAELLLPMFGQMSTPYAASNQRSMAPQMMEPYMVRGEAPKSRMTPYVSEASASLFGSPAGAANMYPDQYMSMPEYISSRRR